MTQISTKSKTKRYIYIFSVILFTSFFLLYPILITYKYRTLEMLLPTCLSFALIMVVWIISLKKNIMFKIFDSKYLILLILLIALALRIISAIIFKDSLQVSAFLKAYNTAEKLDFSNFHRTYTHWILLPVILHYVFAIFGQSQIVLSIFNSLVSVATCYVVYIIAKQISGNKATSNLAALIYALYPSSILYINVCTQEHIGSLLFCITVLIIIKLRSMSSNKLVIYGAGLGILLGIADNFKQLSVIILVACIILYVLDFLTHKSNIKKMLINSLVIILIFICFWGTKQIIFKCFDNIIGQRVSRNTTAYFLTVGLSSESKGFWSESVSNKFNEYLEKFDYDYDMVNKIMYKDLLKDLKENGKNMYLFLPAKIKTAVSQDRDITSWLSIMITDENKQNFLTTKFNNVSDCYYLSMLVLSVFGIIKYLYELFKYKIENNALIMLYIILFGFFLLMIVSEAQDRYKYPLIPLLTVIAGISIYPKFRIFKNE